MQLEQVKIAEFGTCFGTCFGGVDSYLLRAEIRRAVAHNRFVPRLATFYGIVIYMYRPDHPPPHFHAQYGEHVAQIELETLRVINGSLPPRALRLVVEWATLHPEELQGNWQLAQALEPLVPIEPLP